MKELNTFLEGLRPNSQRRYRTVLYHFAEFLDGPLSKATVESILEFNSAMRKKSLSGATIRNALEVLRSYYAYLQRTGKIDSNPVASSGVRVPHKFWNQKRPTQIVPFEQVKAFCDSPSRHTPQGIRDRAILALLFGGGLRKSEVINLTLDDVRLQPTDGEPVYYLRLTDTKAGHPDEQAIPEWAAERVTRSVEARKSEGADNADPLFVHYFVDGRPKQKPIDIRTFDRVFHRWRDYSGLPDGITPHSARATAISQLLALGIPIREVQEFARHANVTTTEQYDRRYFGVENSVARKLEYQ